jgi:hypothetical protein
LADQRGNDGGKPFEFFRVDVYAVACFAQKRVRVPIRRRRVVNGFFERAFSAFFATVADVRIRYGINRTFGLPFCPEALLRQTKRTAKRAAGERRNEAKPSVVFFPPNCVAKPRRTLGFVCVLRLARRRKSCAEFVNFIP